MPSTGQRNLEEGASPLRGHPLSTYAPRGKERGLKAGKYAYDSTDRLREKRTRGGEEVKKAGKSAYVLNGCSLTLHFIG